MTPTNTPNILGGACLWQQQYGGSTANDNAFPYSVAVDASNNVYVAGKFSSDATGVNFAGSTLVSVSGSYDIYLTKRSGVNGALTWLHQIGAGGLDQANGVTVDSAGNVIATGQFQQTVNFGGGNVTAGSPQSYFVAKYTGGNNFIWLATAAGAIGTSVVTDASNNVYVAGNFSGTVNFGTGNLTSFGSLDVFIAKYNSSGTIQWARQYGGTGQDFPRSIAVDSAGNLYTTGTMFANADFGCGTLVDTGSSRDIFFAKLSGVDGTCQWSKVFGSSGNDEGGGVAVDSSSNVYLTAYFSGPINFGLGVLTPVSSNSDIFIGKYNSAGTAIYTHQYGGPGNIGNTPGGISVDASNNLLFTGQATNPIDLGCGTLTGAVSSQDPLIAKYNSTGICQWSKRTGGGFPDDGNAIAAGPDLGVIGVGDFWTSVNWGCGTMNSPGGQDAYVVKLNP